MNAESLVQESSGDQGVDDRNINARVRLLVTAILIVCALAYAETLRYGFVFDDREQILQNPLVQSWGKIPRLFTHHVWADVYPDSVQNYYRPIFLLWLLIHYKLFGENPLGWHLTAVALHLLVTLLVYLLARRVVKDTMAAVIAALIFGLHPIHIESVAWISGLTDPLLAACFIPAFLFYLMKRDPESEVRRSVSLSWSLVFYALALLCKETAVVLPLIIFAYEFLLPSDMKTMDRERLRFHKFSSWRAVSKRLMSSALRVLPYIAVTVVYVAIRALVLNGLGHKMMPLAGTTIIYTLPSIIWFYVKLLLWPVALSVFYDLEYVTVPSLSNFALPLLGTAAVSLSLWLWLRHRLKGNDRRAMLIACLLLVIPILPVLNLSMFVAGEIAHDRYLYLPSIGFSIIAALALRHLNAGRARLFGQPAIQVIAVGVISCALALETVHQHAYWSSEIVLDYHGLTVAPNNKIARTNLANALSERGMYEEALGLFEQVYDRYPTDWPANYNIGYNLYKLGRFKEAEGYLNRATAIRPREPQQYLTLAVTLFEMDRLPEAERVIDRAIELRPHGYGFHYARGAILKVKGNLQAALEEFKTEIAFYPDYESARQQISEIESLLSAKS